MVMRETSLSCVGPTARLSILKPRRGKQAGYAGKHARFVGNQHADGIAAQVFGIHQHIAAHLRQFRQNESIGEPGATIGATISSISSMHSMMQGSRFSTAVLNAAANASTVSTRVPLRP